MGCPELALEIAAALELEATSPALSLAVESPGIQLEITTGVVLEVEQSPIVLEVGTAGIPGPAGADGSTAPTILDATCTAAELIDDLVYVAGFTGATPHVRTCDVDDDAKMPAIGLILEKPTSTTARIQIAGQLTVAGGAFTPGAYVWVSTGSQLGDTRPPAPATGSRLVQRVGRAVTDELIVLDPHAIPWRVVA